MKPQVVRASESYAEEPANSIRAGTTLFPHYRLHPLLHVLITGSRHCLVQVPDRMNTYRSTYLKPAKHCLHTSSYTLGGKKNLDSIWTNGPSPSNVYGGNAFNNVYNAAAGTIMLFEV